MVYIQAPFPFGIIFSTLNRIVPETIIPVGSISFADAAVVLQELRFNLDNKSFKPAVI